MKLSYFYEIVMKGAWIIYFLALDPIENENYLEIKDLLFEHTVHLNISYRIEKFLGEIIIKDGFQEVLNYIQNRFSF